MQHPNRLCWHPCQRMKYGNPTKPTNLLLLFSFSNLMVYFKLLSLKRLSIGHLFIAAHLLLHLLVGYRHTNNGEELIEFYRISIDFFFITNRLLLIRIAYAQY